jgi:two-component system chemotaxis response regulator CheB
VTEKYLLAIGASTGGVEATKRVLAALPPIMPPIIVVQHMPTGFTEIYADSLDKMLPFHALEPKDGMALEPNTVYVAQAGRQFRIEKHGAKFFAKLGGPEKYSGHCPSVDIMFESVARVAGARAAGVILTGMGADGAEGLKLMHDVGCFTVGQDEKSCVVFGMPRKAYENGAVSKLMTPEEIARAVVFHFYSLK